MANDKTLLSGTPFRTAVYAFIIAACACSTLASAQTVSVVSLPPLPSPSSIAGDANTLSAICTDRPTKSNYACTVDPGHFQYEADLVNGSFLRENGVTSDSYVVINPTLKYGLAPNIDVEASLSPLDVVRTRDEARDRTVVGISDLYLRAKYEFLNVHGGQLQATILPYLKAPTARPGIGNGAVEGGVILPVNYALSGALTLTVDPEVDVYKNSTGSGRHMNTAQVLNLAICLPGHVSVYGELWGDWNFEPTGTVRQYSADTAVAYGISPYLQLDAGVNFGLNRNTPAVQAYVGVSQKF